MGEGYGDSLQLHNCEKISTVEPRFNEVVGDRPNLFVKWRVRYIEVLFHIFYCNFGRDIEIISFVISRTSLNRGSLNRGSTVSQNKDILVSYRRNKTPVVGGGIPYGRDSDTCHLL